MTKTVGEKGQKAEQKPNNVYDQAFCNLAKLKIWEGENFPENSTIENTFERGGWVISFMSFLK